MPDTHIADGLVVAETAVKDLCGTGDMRGITEITLQIIGPDYEGYSGDRNVM
jgi:hypothetical protein